MLLYIFHFTVEIIICKDKMSWLSLFIGLAKWHVDMSICAIFFFLEAIHEGLKTSSFKWNAPALGRLGEVATVVVPGEMKVKQREAVSG